MSSTPTPQATEATYRALKASLAGMVRLNRFDIEKFNARLRAAPQEGAYLTRAVRKELQAAFKQVCGREAFAALKRLKDGQSAALTAAGLQEEIRTVKTLFAYSFRDERRLKGLHFQADKAGRSAALTSAQGWIAALSVSDAPCYELKDLRLKLRRAAGFLRIAGERDAGKVHPDKSRMLVAVFRKACKQCSEARIKRMESTALFNTPEKIARERQEIHRLHRAARIGEAAFKDDMSAMHRHALHYAEISARTPSSQPSNEIWRQVCAAHSGFLGSLDPKGERGDGAFRPRPVQTRGAELAAAL